jgi:uncharacterized membrane protein
MALLNPLDLVGLGCFVGGWIVYAAVIEWSARGGLNARMDRYREVWMRRMLAREMRMIDMQIMASLQTGTAFFASTSLIAIGGALTLLRSTEEMVVPRGGAAPQVSPSTTAAMATMTMATVAVSTVTVVATQRISRSWPARKATARGIAAGMAGRVSTDIGQAPIFAGVDTQGKSRLATPRASRISLHATRISLQTPP